MTAIDGAEIGIHFDNSYAALPDRFFARLAPTPVAAPKLIRLNGPVARMLGLDPQALAVPEAAAFFAGNRIAGGSEPIAMAYAGHQFGNFVPQLGDGRAHLLGEIVGPDRRRWDLHLKGSGPTPFSRRGDGRAALGPVLREYLVSEGMFALGIPTTRALAAVATGEQVQREGLLPGAVLARVAASHVRVGTFQYFSARNDIDGVRTLADYVIARHYQAEVAEAVSNGVNPYQRLLASVVARQAELVAQWMLVGFIHGVMNTDNMSIAGETIDFGPCAFMDFYDPATVYSSIDRRGRYAYGNQPRIAIWNLSRLAEALLPLLGATEAEALPVAEDTIGGFAAVYEAAFERGFLRKIGITDSDVDDVQLIQGFLEVLARARADFTSTFRALGPTRDDYARVRENLSDHSAFDQWWTVWQHRLAMQGRAHADVSATMQAANPIYIPRNHLVEEAIAAAVGSDDYGPFDRLLGAIADPFTERGGLERYALPPRPEEEIEATFCGT